MKSLMEEKQLDFNQPLLSVRRFPPKVATETEKKSKTSRNSSIRLPPLPVYKSDLKSGPVSHPGAVPFIWEQTPGRPKSEGKLPSFGVVEQLPLTPNLPPGRASRVKKHQDSDQVSKGSPISKSETKHKKILKEVMQEKDSSDDDSDDGDEAYQDALDTLSTTTTESFFMNCSASGLSTGFDDQETQPFGSFSSDQPARNFMIGRFLPAVKAIASESPQYASRKPPPVTQEEPRQVKEVVQVSRQRYSPLRQIVLSHYARDINGEGESEDEDDNESDESENNATTKVCGLFPRLCFLNPLPELRMGTKSSNTRNGTRKEHARTSHREKKSVYSQFDPQRRGSNKLSAFENAQCDFGCASPVVEKTLYIDSVHEVKSHSNSSSSAMKGQTNHHTWDPFETSIKESGYCKKPSIVPRSSESLDLPFTCYPDRSINDIHMHFTNHSNKIEHEIDLDKSLSISRLDGNVEVDLKSLLAAHSTDQECSKWVSNGKTDLENQSQKRTGNEEAIDSMRLPLSLPSPKAPSESWLKRTLPTISSSNVTAKIPAPSRIANNTATHDPKWERIVKSSEEILTTIPED